MFRIGTAALRLGHRAGEGPRTRAHLDSAVAGGPHVCIHAHSPIHVNGQARGAFATEGSLRVDAAAIHANARRLTLIDVWRRKGTTHFRLLVNLVQKVENHLQYCTINEKGTQVFRVTD